MRSFIGVINKDFCDIDHLLNTEVVNHPSESFEWFYRNCGIHPATGDTIYMVESGVPGIMLTCRVLSDSTNTTFPSQYTSDMGNRSARFQGGANRVILVSPVIGGVGSWKFVNGGWINTNETVRENWKRGELKGPRQGTFKEIPEHLIPEHWKPESMKPKTIKISVRVSPTKTEEKGNMRVPFNVNDCETIAEVDRKVFGTIKNSGSDTGLLVFDMTKLLAQEWMKNKGNEFTSGKIVYKINTVEDSDRVVVMINWCPK